jgi:dipeptidyl aminopeptidase/acylaminoacyl peptidase
MWFPMSEYCPHDKWGCTPFNSENEREGYEKFSPESRVYKWNTPHLIIHGSKDYRIPITEGISAFTALQIRNVESRFLHFPDENHWVLKPENSIKWYDEVLGWLDKFLDNN